VLPGGPFTPLADVYGLALVLANPLPVFRYPGFLPLFWWFLVGVRIDTQFLFQAPCLPGRLAMQRQSARVLAASRKVSQPPSRAEHDSLHAPADAAETVPATIATIATTHCPVHALLESFAVPAAHPRAAEYAIMEALASERARYDEDAAAACRREAALLAAVRAKDVRIAAVEEEVARAADGFALAVDMHAKRVKELGEDVLRHRHEAAYAVAALEAKVADLTAARLQDSVVCKNLRLELEQHKAVAGAANERVAVHAAEVAASRAQSGKHAEEARIAKQDNARLLDGMQSAETHVVQLQAQVQQLTREHCGCGGQVAAMEELHQADFAALKTARAAEVRAVSELSSCRDAWEVERSEAISRINVLETALTALHGQLAEVQTARVLDANRAYRRENALRAAVHGAAQADTKSVDVRDQPVVRESQTRCDTETAAETVPFLTTFSKKRALSSDTSDSDDGGATTESDTDLDVARRTVHWPTVRSKPLKASNTVSGAHQSAATIRDAAVPMKCPATLVWQPDSKAVAAVPLAEVARFPAGSSDGEQPNSKTVATVPLAEVARSPAGSSGCSEPHPSVAEASTHASQPCDDSQDEPPKQYPCRMCNCIYASKGGRTRHEKYHARFVCSVCCESFLSMTLFMAHGQEQHGAIPPVPA